MNEPRLTHLDASGAASMVDVGDKAETKRFASAEGMVLMAPATLELIQSGSAKKGDVIATARIAGIMAAKRTSDLIPLCHPLALDKVAVEIEPEPALPGLRVRATAQLTGRTGVEMEALTAVAVACLTIYDMAKAVDRGMEITAVRLVEKTGGASGDWTAGEREPTGVSLLSVDDAFERLSRGVAPVARTETVELRHAYGRVLAIDLVATRTQPDFDASAMDGYALRADDARAPFEPLRLIGESAAGRAFAGSISAGKAVRIFTGAPVPDGADSILIQENAERPTPDLVRPLEAVVPGRHIRKAGADFSRGEVLIRKGKRLTSGAVALAASGGHPVIEVLARPRVAILATGDELVLPGAPLGPSQIVASNTFGVAAMVRSAGAEVLDYGIARDDEAEIAGRIDRAVADGADILVTIGGASVGDHDLIGKVFAAQKVELDFWKVAMRPGKPLMAGRLGPMRLIGLPGNPASSMVAATLFLKPLVAALAGMPERTIYRNGILGCDMPENDLRADFIRATIDEASSVHPIVNPAGRQDSSLLSVYARADVLLFAPAARASGQGWRSLPFHPLD